MGLDIIFFDEDCERVGVQCKQYSPNRRMIIAKEAWEFIEVIRLQ